MPVRFRIRVQGGSAALRGFIKSYLDAVAKPRSQQRAAIEGIINRGILRNHERLANLGSVRQAGGGLAVSWLQVRHPITVNIRLNQGLQPLVPLLHGRGGFLQRAYARGGVLRSAPDGFTWERRGGAGNRLMQAHEEGLRRLPTRNDASLPDSFRNMRLPARPSTFWSEEMHDQVMGIVKRHGVEEARRRGFKGGGPSSAQEAYSASRRTQA